MKKYLVMSALSFAIITVAMFTNGCKVTKEVADKGGSELWAENCSRCHNAPAGSAYTAEHWDVIGMHMRMRAHVTADETRKITEFLQSAKK